MTHPANRRHFRPPRPKRQMVTVRLDAETYARLCDHCGRDPNTPGHNPLGVGSIQDTVTTAIRQYLSRKP